MLLLLLPLTVINSQARRSSTGPLSERACAAQCDPCAGLLPSLSFTCDAAGDLELAAGPWEHNVAYVDAYAHKASSCPAALAALAHGMTCAHWQMPSVISRTPLSLLAHSHSGHQSNQGARAGRLQHEVLAADRTG